jgi:gamma-glutamylcyclotransferase (GGCT)/AIG2-like uncharacterized protein YtfP
MKNTQYITNKKGKKLSVVLPIREYERMLADLDELESIKAYDKVKSSKQKYMAAEEAFNYLSSKRKK